MEMIDWINELQPAEVIDISIERLDSPEFSAAHSAFEALQAAVSVLREQRADLDKRIDSLNAELEVLADAIPSCHFCGCTDVDDLLRIIDANDDDFACASCIEEIQDNSVDHCGVCGVLWRDHNYTFEELHEGVVKNNACPRHWGLVNED